MAFALNIVVCIKDREHIAVLDDSAFNSPQYEGEEGICDVRDDDADNARAAGLQTSRMIVRIIVEVPHCSLNPLLQPRTDCIAIVEHI